LRAPRNALKKASKVALPMSDKTGKLYENLTQVVFQAILGQKEFPNLKVERDIVLQGITVPHQIDVYWKFELGGIPHETIVQTKDWNRPVEKGHLLTFKSVLDDLPGQPRGIYVTRSGYQSGAKDFALAHGILLYELREADYPPALELTLGGWAKVKLIRMPVQALISVCDLPGDASKVVSLGFEFDTYTPKYTAITFGVNEDSFKKSYPQCAPDPTGRLDFPGVANHSERIFFDDEGTNVGNLGIITTEIIEGIKKDYVDRKEVKHVFDRPVFIDTKDARFPRLEVNSVSITVEIEHRHCVRRGRMSSISQLVLHQLNEDKKWWFAATPEVLTKLVGTLKEKPELV
jgi:hypothetical protein